MAKGRQSLRNLAKLLPSGAAGISISLASAGASAMAVAAEPAAKDAGSVNERLQSIRRDVTSVMEQYAKDREPVVGVDPEERLAWWGNAWRNGGGWHNGGWANGGGAWHNGGWANGGGAWHNGGWANGGGGWHNGGFRNW